MPWVQLEEPSHLAFVVTTAQVAVETALAVFGSKAPKRETTHKMSQMDTKLRQPAEDADEHAKKDDSDSREEDMPPGHIESHFIRPEQGAASSRALHSPILAIRSAVPLLGESNALAIVASPHLLAILLHHQSSSTEHGLVGSVPTLMMYSTCML